MIAISENLDDEAQERLCKSDQKRKQTMPKNLDDEAKQKIYKADKKKKKTIRENLDDEAKEKLCTVIEKEIKQINENPNEEAKKQKRNQIKVIKKESKRFMKIWMMKPNRKYVKQPKK